MPTDLDALIADVLQKHDAWQTTSGPDVGRAYRVVAANAAPVLARELKRCREAIVAAAMPLESIHASTEWELCDEIKQAVAGAVLKIRAALTPEDQS